LIYCQYYLLSLGFPVTWDNPDIYVFEGSALVNPDQLKANTAYTVVARIWNNSSEVPVVNLNVAFSFLSFGMGTKSNPIGSSTTDLSVQIAVARERKMLLGCPGCLHRRHIGGPENHSWKETGGLGFWKLGTQQFNVEGLAGKYS